MNPGSTFPERYEILRELGRGGAGITYLAREVESGHEVVAKLLHFGLLGDWKSVELLEREASVLKALHHERIPAYVDYFSTDEEGVPRFVLVREYVQGTSLQARVDGGWRGTEEEIRDIGVRLARIVAYIHAVRPPVIHRDINPRNIIVRDDAEVFLVDFGGVQDAIRVSTGATTTFVGTPGYTPMEQFVGRATVRSDLYASAATLLFLLTHRNPADLPLKNMKIDFPAVIELSSPGLSQVLANWLEPEESRRSLGTEEAIALLEGREWHALPRGHVAAESEVRPGQARPVSDRPPHGSRIVRTVENGVVSFLLPEGGRGRGTPMFGSLWFFWLMFGGFWLSSRMTLGRPLAVILMALPVLAIGISMLAWTLSRVFGKLGVAIDREGLTYTRRLFFFSSRRTVPLEDVGECTLEVGREPRARSRHGYAYARRARYRFGDSDAAASFQRLRLDIGARTLRFGEHLSTREREWLRDAINAELRTARAQLRD